MPNMVRERKRERKNDRLDSITGRVEKKETKRTERQEDQELGKAVHLSTHHGNKAKAGAFKDEIWRSSVPNARPAWHPTN